MTFSGRLRRQSAICRTSLAHWAVIRDDIDHPMTAWDHSSITTARYSQPSSVQRYVMSPVTCPLLVRDTCVKILFQQIFCHWQVVCTVASQAALSRGFRSRLLMLQAGCNCSRYIPADLQTVVGTIPMFWLSECLIYGIITGESELLTRAGLIAAQTLGIPAAAPQSAIHGTYPWCWIHPDDFRWRHTLFQELREVCCGLLENGQLLSSLSASWRLRWVISAACSPYRSEDIVWLCCLLCQL